MNVQEIIQFTKAIAGYQKRENDLIIGSMQSPSPVRVPTTCVEIDIKETLENDNIELEYLMSKEYEDMLMELDHYLKESFKDVEYNLHSTEHKDGRIDISYIDVNIGNPIVITVHVMMRDPRYFVIKIYDADGNELNSSIKTGIYTTHKEANDKWVTRVDEWVGVCSKICDKSIRDIKHKQKQYYLVTCNAKDGSEDLDFILVKAKSFTEAYDILWKNIVNEINMKDCRFLNKHKKEDFMCYHVADEDNRKKFCYRSNDGGEIHIELVKGDDNYVYVGGTGE